MKKLIWMALISFAIVSCDDDKPNPELELLKAEKEAIMRESSAKDSTINSFLESLNEIEDNLGAIKQKQSSIAVSAKNNGEMQGNAKDRINEDIQFISELMEENKKKISNLQSKLKSSNLKIAEFEKTMERMTIQLQEKDAEIVQLKEQLAAMNIQITELSTAVSSLKTEGETKAKVIEQQTTKMNTAFYAIGSFKELRDNKVVNKEGGFLGLGKEKKLQSDFNQDYFTQIDISKVTSIPINGKDPKIVTNHPSDSYKFNNESKKLVKSISITNPEKFWRSSKYLVIIIDK